MTPAATIAMLSPQDAYQLGVLDERLRQAEQAREEAIMSMPAVQKPKPNPKPKAPKAPETAHTNGDAQTAIPETIPSPPE